MAKKSNKTEQVLKLITKDEGTIEKLVERESVMAEAPPENLSLGPEEEPEVSIALKEKPFQELKYEAKLTIEIDPALELKENKNATAKSLENKPPENKAPASRVEGLWNLSEILVRDRAEDVMGKMRVCNCPSCLNDVLALALNNLPAKYITTDAGKQFVQLEMYKKQIETDVLAALTKACVRVKAAPRH